MITMAWRWGVGLLVLASWAAAAGAQTDAEHEASNDPQKCADLWRYTAQRAVTMVCHRGRFLTLHNNNNRSPVWVLERLSTSRTLTRDGESRPSQSFVQEQLVPKAARGSDEDYEGNAYDLARGHMAPSEDFNRNVEAMKGSFILSNAVPQIGSSFNGSIWKRLEEEVRDVVIDGPDAGERYVITGPVQRYGGSRTRSIIKARSCGEEFELKGPPQKRLCDGKNTSQNPNCGTKGIAIPIAVFKIVYNPRTYEAHAFVLANKRHDSHTGQAGRTYIDQHRVKLATIERITGIRFFTDLPREKRTKAAQCAATPFWTAPPNAAAPQRSAESPTR
jgi:DNA/RNA endonuclease G (NUC1)